MKTPETKAGRLTELVMARVRGKLPELPTYEYNRVYECVLAELNCHVLGETHEIPKRECSICKGNGFIDVEKYDRVEQEDCKWCGTTGIEPQPPMPEKPEASAEPANDGAEARDL